MESDRLSIRDDGVRLPEAAIKKGGCTCNLTSESASDQRAFLRIKLKSLAAESRIIRQEERRNKRLASQLAVHRRDVVRPAARNTLLAYSFLRGRYYGDVEHLAKVPPNWKEVERMVVQYGRQADYGRETYPQFQQAKAEELERLRAWPKT